MAPNLAESSLEIIRDIILSDELTASEMARAAGCSKRAIFRIRSNLRLLVTWKMAVADLWYSLKLVLR
jgi:hypothetical protein